MSILYDNTKLAVVEILADGHRVKTRRFLGLPSHYLFPRPLCRPGKGNDKGKVDMPPSAIMDDVLAKVTAMFV